MQAIHVESLPPKMRPITRRERFYVDPESGERELTLIVAIKLDKKTRYILGQSPLEGGELIIVADADGRIPYFESKDAAKAYITRVFSVEVAGGEPALGESFEQRINEGDTPTVDFDAVHRWTRDTGSDAIDAAQAALAWDVLAGASAAPIRLPFDPMGMYAWAENAGRGSVDSTTFAVAMAGMKISGFVWEAREQKGLERDAPFHSDESVWTASDRKTLARILAGGLAEFRTRLSAEAALTDVRATWPAPAPPKLIVTDPRATPSTDPPPPRQALQPLDLEAMINARLGQPGPRGGVSPVAYNRYLREREAYASDLRLYYRQEYKYKDAARRTVPLRISVTNVGQLRARNVSIVFHFPAGMMPVLEDVFHFTHDMPDEPRAPHEYERPGVRRTPYTPNERVLRAGSDFTNPDAVRAPDGSWTLERKLPYGIAAQDGHEVFGVYAQFRDLASVRAFDYDVTVRYDGGEPVTTRLHIGAHQLP